MAGIRDLSGALPLGKALRGSPGVGHYVFAFVFLLRLVVLARLSSTALLLPSGGDMHFYDDWAKQILQGQLTDHRAFYGLPLYAYLLAFLYKLFGYSPFVPGFLQACLEAGTATLLYKISIRIFRDAGKFSATAIGLMAAAGWAFFVPAQAYSLILMPAAWGIFILWWLIWDIVKTEQAPSPLRSLAYGAIVGFTATGVATILFLVPLLLAALFLKTQAATKSASPRRALLSATALLFLGVICGTSPCWMHNAFVARDPVFLSAHSGINFWLGNNPEATGYPHFPGMRAGQATMLRDSIDLAQSAAGRSLQHSEISAYWSAKARAHIKDNFSAWVKLMGRKLGNFWNAFEYDDLGIISNLRETGLLFPGIRFGIVAAFALPALVFSWRRFPGSRWVAAAVLLHMAAVLPVFVTERYRLAVVPGILIFAAFGLQQLWQSCISANYGKIAIYLALLLVSLFLVTLPRTDPSLWAMQAYNSGRLALESNDLSRAEKNLKRAQAYVPVNSEITFALGNLRWAQADLSAAKGFYERTLAADSTHKGALNNLGILALDEKEWARAADLFRILTRVAPEEAKGHYLLARAALAVGQKSEAMVEIETALRLKPGQPEFVELQEMMRGLP